MLGRLALGADEQHAAASGGDFAHLQQRLVQQRHRLRQVDDVDVGLLAEDVAVHLRVPAVGLVSEMRASFQELTHAEFRQRHEYRSFSGLPPRERPRNYFLRPDGGNGRFQTAPPLPRAK